jgi:hypothetical protein
MITGFNHDVWKTVPLVTWESLYQAMEELHIDTLWVLPSDPLSRDITYEWFKDIPSSFSWYSPPTNTYDGKPYILRLRRLHYKHAYPDRYIVFPAHMECCIPRSGDRGQWTLLDQPDNLRTTLDYIENEIGIPYLWSNGHVGEEYLRKIHKGIRTEIKPFNDPQQLEFFQQVLHGAMDRAVWRNTLQSFWHQARKLSYIVGFDKNGQYIGAANSAFLGNGNYAREVTAVEWSFPHMRNYVGFWKYRIEDVSNTPFNGYDLPCPLDVNRQWASTALINCAFDLGIDIEIEGGIIWQEQGRYLAKWASNYWQHRLNLRDPEKYPDTIARDNAERSMKAQPNSMVGRFMNEYSKEYFHKDWQLEIIHQAVASQAYSMRYWLENYDAKPVLVNKDAVYFLCNNPELFAPIDKYSQELRGFKKIGVAPLSDTIIEAFSEEKSINKLESLIKEEMKQYDRH